jgi:DNA-binding ferritin-like protein
MTTSTTPKAVNYTAEQTAQMVEQYSANPTADTVAELAKALGKTARSIVAKLSREKVYKAKTYATKTGEAVISKEDLADKLTKLADLTAAEADSLTKANKTALKKIVTLLEEAAED